MNKLPRILRHTSIFSKNGGGLRWMHRRIDPGSHCPIYLRGMLRLPMSGPEFMIPFCFAYEQQIHSKNPTRHRRTN